LALAQVDIETPPAAAPPAPGYGDASGAGLRLGGPEKAENKHAKELGPCTTEEASLEAELRPVSQARGVHPPLLPPWARLGADQSGTEQHYHRIRAHLMGGLHQE
jgi:hypothetical protein